MVEVECGGFVFTSNFESGNMARVEQVPLPPKPPSTPGQTASNSEVPDYEFNIWTNPDCAGTEFENSNRSWFYFGIRGGSPFALVKLNLVNLNKQSKMYSQGMAPVYRILPGRGLWDRIREKPSYTVEDNVFTLSFRYRTLDNVRATTYFAFTFPYSYQDLMTSLRGFDKRFKNSSPPEKYFPGQSFSGVSADDIYYHRELACFSLDGRRLDLLTITSHHGITPLREPRLKNLFPDLDTPRSHIFVGKKVIFVSARVHPGEVPSSYVLNGLLESLLNQNDVTSVLLRRMYVFKIVPMLNPDGVARGHFRTDTRGVNLNRVYLNPSLSLHPTIYAARAIIKYAHYRKEIADEPTNCADDSENVSNDTVPPESRNLTTAEDFNVPVGATSRLSCSVGLSGHSTQSSSIFEGVCANEASNEKDNLAMQCEALEEDSISMDDNLTSRDLSSCEKKEPFNAGFPSNETGSTTCETKDLVDSPNSTKELDPQDSQKSSNDDTKLIIPNLSLSPDENSGLEDLKRKKDVKRKSVVNSGKCKPACKNDDGGEETELYTVKPSLDPSSSGLFLYMDMHGHASKKGIFMYGNHFDDLDQLVECMLLPKVMSINSQNFHFTACNFTERNMYLRDRRDGMSREGCGRVSVMKMTGLIRSYTLECNYNTGRMVNLLPPCVRDSGRMSVNPTYAVPPKYTPLVFEDVGRAFGVSILDITNSNPYSRVPNSEYRSVNGIREWLRTNCLSENQLWTRMLHRPTRQQVAKKWIPEELPLPIPPEVPTTEAPLLTALNRVDSNDAQPSVFKKSAAVDISEESVISEANCDRWYSRRKALEYEKELELERVKVFERYKSIVTNDKDSKANDSPCSEREQKLSIPQRCCDDARSGLDDDLDAKREKVKRIRDHDKLVHERFGITVRHLFRTKTIVGENRNVNSNLETENSSRRKPESSEEVESVNVEMGQDQGQAGQGQSGEQKQLLENRSLYDAEHVPVDSGMKDSFRGSTHEVVPDGRKVMNVGNDVRKKNEHFRIKDLKGGKRPQETLETPARRKESTVRRKFQEMRLEGKDKTNIKKEKGAFKGQSTKMYSHADTGGKTAVKPTAIFEKGKCKLDKCSRLVRETVVQLNWCPSAPRSKSKNGSGTLLTYGNQTDTNMGDVIFREVARVEKTGLTDSVGQSSSSHSVPGSSGHNRPVHLTKSVLLAKLSTELKTMGEAYARRERIKIQKPASCSQLDSVVSASGSQPKENIGPSQCGAKGRHSRAPDSSIQHKVTPSGILQQRSKTSPAANIAGTTRRKVRSSGCNSGSSLRPISKTKVIRQKCKLQDNTSVENSVQSEDSISTETIADDSKTSHGVEMCATSKRLKISNKPGCNKLRKKQKSWIAKPPEHEENTQCNTEQLVMSWSPSCNVPPQLIMKKGILVKKIDKSSRVETGKFRPGNMNKSKCVKKSSLPSSSNVPENLLSKADSSEGFGKFACKMPSAKDSNLSICVSSKKDFSSADKNRLRSKTSLRTSLVKTSKVDISVPGPSAGEPCSLENKLDSKFKSNVLRSLEKGSKSRMLCPVRRRNNDGKKSWKSIERKACSTENSNLCTPSTSKAELSDAN